MAKGNKLCWFPMRIRHSSISRLEKLLEQFNNLGQVYEQEGRVLEAYVPLKFIKVSVKKMDFAPYMLNYIFVRSTFKQLLLIKTQPEFEPIRFVMHPEYDEKYNKHTAVLTIPDKIMSDFKRMTAEENEKVIFLRDLQFASKPGKAVQVIEGPFTGVIGHIKRIQGRRCVVVPIGDKGANIMAPAIIDVHNSQLIYLSETNEDK